MSDDYQLYLITTLVFIRLLLDEIYKIIELLLFDWWSMFVWLIDCLPHDLILGLCYSNLTLETGRFELASTITLVLQGNRLIKCARRNLEDKFGVKINDRDIEFCHRAGTQGPTSVKMDLFKLTLTETNLDNSKYTH